MSQFQVSYFWMSVGAIIALSQLLQYRTPTDRFLSTLSPEELQEVLPLQVRESVQVQMIIAFCESCSYAERAIKLRRTLKNYYPGLEILLMNYPFNTVKDVLIKLFLAAWMGLNMFILIGDWILLKLGFRLPPWLCFVCGRTNQSFSLIRKLQSITLTTFVGIMTMESVFSTGAFEVHYKGQQVFSKLSSGRFPMEEELVALIGKMTDTLATQKC